MNQRLERFYRKLRSGRTAVISVPYLWLIIFFALPFVILLRISVTHVGPDGAGHFVKMVHNGIEYADMQFIGEAYDLLKGAGLSATEAADVFAQWNTGDLDSYLIEITSEVLRKVDADTGKPLVEVIVDAERGVLDLAPTAERIATAKAVIERQSAARAEVLALAHDKAETTDGVRIEVAANIATASDAAEAVKLGAESVGLLRTELLFLERETAPSQAEQRAAYQAVIDGLEGKSAIIRTLDVGADKSLPYIPMPEEENPALGLRGIRLCIARQALLVEQLRAILAVQPLSAVKIMLPMVVDASEIVATRVVLDRLTAEMGIAGRVELGVMIETPSAAILADQLAKEADFFSVGTNDLTQYALCMDRTNPALAARVDGLHPAVLPRFVRLWRQPPQAEELAVPQQPEAAAPSGLAGLWKKLVSKVADATEEVAAVAEESTLTPEQQARLERARLRPWDDERVLEQLNRITDLRMALHAALSA